VVGTDHAYNLTISTFLPVELGIVDKIMLILFKVDNARIDIDVLMFFFYQLVILVCKCKD